MLTTDVSPAFTPPVAAIDPTPLDRLLRGLAPEMDRRHKDRVATPYLFLLVPLEDLGRGKPGPEIDQPLTVVGKDLSGRGIGFFHEQPLAYRYVRLKVNDPQLGSFQIDVQLTRCRFTKLGWYESGGKILAVSE